MCAAMQDWRQRFISSKHVQNVLRVLVVMGVGLIMASLFQPLLPLLDRVIIYAQSSGREARPVINTHRLLPTPSDL